MKYVILINDKYHNSYKSYGEANKEKEILLHRFPKANISIINYSEFKV